VTPLKESYAVGFDIGGTNTKIGLVSSSGQILQSTVIPTSVNTAGVDAYLKNLFTHLRILITNTGFPIRGIGGALLGWINDDHSTPFLCLNAPALHGIQIKAMLEAEFHLSVSLVDDSTAHTLAEYHYGTGKGLRRFMCLALGTGVVAGVMINGKPLDFTGGCAGDTGHIILRPDGPACSAGCRGCAEALIGSAGIERLAYERFNKQLSTREIIELARDKSDPDACAVIKQIGMYTGELLASLTHIFLPEIIAISGGVATAGPLLLNAIQERFIEVNGEYHNAYSSMAGEYYKGVNIVIGQLLGETGMIGAAVPFFFKEYLAT
jgi:glucokinase